MSTEARGVQSIEVGSRLLDAMIATGEPMMLKDIAKMAGIAPAQAHAYLVSYRKGQLVEQDEASGRYRLGPMALQLGIARLRSFDPFQAASEGASELASDTGLTVAVSVWGSYGPTVVQVHEGVDQILINTRPATVYSITGTATGRVFAAFLPSELVAAGIKAQRAEGREARYVGNLPTLKEIADELAFIRDHRYAPVRSSPIPGINAIAAPVFEVGGQLHMVLTLIGASTLLDIAPGGSHISLICDLAKRISTRAGYF
jgi:DNA-binding IclR family transcriptional regulator